MINKLIDFSIRNKLIIGIFTLSLIVWGTYSIKQISIDAVPDITNNQVQIITQSGNLAAPEVEQFITYPIELAMQNIPGVIEVRSISRFGLSLVTVVFKDEMGIYLPRQLVDEKLAEAQHDIPNGFGIPEKAPISTGLGEVYQYILKPKKGYEEKYNAMDLRTIQDWIVKRQLAGTEGVVDVNSFGGFLKQIEIAVDPDQLKSKGVTIKDVFTALQNNNENAGGSYIEKGSENLYIRGVGRIASLQEIEKIHVANNNGTPILIENVAKVQLGHAQRFGAMGRNGEGEVAGGMVLMMKGENANNVVERVKERIETIKKSLPKGIELIPFIDRSKLVNRTTSTIVKNLSEGGLIVIFVLVLLLGNFRAGLIVASVIPLSLLFAISLMNLFGVSANLMSLGALDFGIVVDGAVIIVEAIVHRLNSKKNDGSKLSQKEMDQEVIEGASKIRKSAAFGEIIILIVYFPILALVGIEGKMFRPMALTVSFAILGAFILSLTYVPMITALFLNKKIKTKDNFSDKIIGVLVRLYEPVLRFSLKFKYIFLAIVIVSFIGSFMTFSKMGAVFIPRLTEGDLVVSIAHKPGTSLTQILKTSDVVEKLLLENVPEVVQVCSRIGTAEIPTDPMPIESADIFVVLKEQEEWTSANSLSELIDNIKNELEKIPGINSEISQPIEHMFNTLISGVRSDIAIKLYGENLDILANKAKEIQAIVSNINGVGDVKPEETKGMPQVSVKYKRSELAKYNLSVNHLNEILQMAFAGTPAGLFVEGERKFDLVVRLDSLHRNDLTAVEDLYIDLENGAQIPIKTLADITYAKAPVQISRNDAKRRIVIGVNVRNRDVESLVEEIKSKLDTQLDLPPGYYINYGGQFENLKSAKERLMIAVPLALALIFALLFFTFNSLKQAMLIFTAIPLSAIGGVGALWIREMPFSISAGVGFIALFGVAVLNGIVLIAYYNQLKKEGITDIKERIITGGKVRLRPVIMTAAVAALGFLPMAFSNSAGGEVQQPLATVVIGGLISATLLTLIILPILYYLFDELKLNKK